MEQTSEIPCCPLPEDTSGDTVQLVVVVAVFLLGSWLLARWKKKRRSNKK